LITIVRKPGIGFYLPLARSECMDLVQTILEALSLASVNLEISLVDDAEIAHLNKTFLGLTGPTNVLGFPPETFGDPFYGELAATLPPSIPRPDTSTVEDVLSLGSIALSLPTLRREALLYGQDCLEHFARMLTHAILHLAGHEHGPAMEALTEDTVEHVLAGNVAILP